MTTTVLSMKWGMSSPALKVLRKPSSVQVWGQSVGGTSMDSTYGLKAVITIQ